MMLLNACQLTLCKVTKDNQNQFSPINTNNMRMLINDHQKKLTQLIFLRKCMEISVENLVFWLLGRF